MTRLPTYAAAVAETRQWMTKEEAAKYLRVGIRTIDRYRKAGQLRSYRLRGSRLARFRVEDLDALAEEIRNGE